MLVEVDAFHLPDTAGTSYRREHTKDDHRRPGHRRRRAVARLLPQRRGTTPWAPRTSPRLFRLADHDPGAPAAVRRGWSSSRTGWPGCRLASSPLARSGARRRTSRRRAAGEPGAPLRRALRGGPPRAARRRSGGRGSISTPSRDAAPALGIVRRAGHGVRAVARARGGRRPGRRSGARHGGRGRRCQDAPLQDRARGDREALPSDVAPATAAMATAVWRPALGALDAAVVRW